MASDRPDPGEFFEMAQRMLRDLFGGGMRSDDEPWAEATHRPRERTESQRVDREPSPQRQRENLTFALATRAVEALEDLALNVAAIRQRLERMDPQVPEAQPGTSGAQPGTSEARPGDEPPGQGGSDAAGQ